MCTGNSQRRQVSVLGYLLCSITSGAIELSLRCLSATIDRPSARGRSIRPIGYSERRNLESQTLSLSLRRHSLTLRSTLKSRFLCDFYSPGSSQSGSIYRWEIEAKISVSVSYFSISKDQTLTYTVFKAVSMCSRKNSLYRYVETHAVNVECDPIAILSRFSICLKKFAFAKRDLDRTTKRMDTHDKESPKSNGNH